MSIINLFKGKWPPKNKHSRDWKTVKLIIIIISPAKGIIIIILSPLNDIDGFSKL